MGLISSRRLGFLSVKWNFWSLLVLVLKDYGWKRLVIGVVSQHVVEMEVVVHDETLVEAMEGRLPVEMIWMVAVMRHLCYSFCYVQ